MSYYYHLSLSHRVCNEILEAIETAVEHTSSFDEIYGFVHLYEHIEEEMSESATKQNKELQRWVAQQKLFEDRKVDDILKFHKIKAVLEKYDVEIGVEDEFHMICDLSEVIQDENKNDE